MAREATEIEPAEKDRFPRKDAKAQTNSDLLSDFAALRERLFLAQIPELDLSRQCAKKREHPNLAWRLGGK
jgi:hypothetical protein